MTIQSTHSLQLSISSQRLVPYQVAGDTDLDTLARYTWNVCLCEAFYPLLHNLEIALRNNLHNAVASHLRNPLWLTSQRSILRPQERTEVGKAEVRLKAAGKRIDVGRVIAELNFGFWTSLLNRHYETVLWPRITNRAFPFLPRSTRPRHILAARFTQIRHLRNRVFHHEPMWNSSHLQTDHDDILEVIEWLSAEVLVITKIVDRFPHVHSQPFQNKLKEQLRTQLK